MPGVFHGRARRDGRDRRDPEGRDLHAAVTGLQWVVDGYTLVFAAFLLAAGDLGDRIGGKPVFLGGLVVFGATSAVCGLVPGFVVLIVARLAQGFGAALMVPASLSLLRASYPDRAGRAWAFGMWGAVAGIAAAAGPVLGGLLVSAIGWRAVFFLNVPIAILAYLLTARHVPSSARADISRFDAIGQITGILCLVGLVTALNEVGSLGWRHPLVLGGFAVFLVALVGFLLAERRVPSPTLPLELFKMGEFSASAVIGLLLNIGFFGFIFITPLYFQQVRHLSALASGLALLPAVIPPMLVSAWAGRLVGRIGPRLLAVAGLIIGAAGLLGWLAATPATAYLMLIVPMAAVGLAPALTMPASTAAIMESAPPERSGVVN